MSARPLILLDVDGVLNALTVNPGPGWEHHTCQSWNGTYRVRLNPSHGPMLLELAEQTGAELVWATTWCDDANREIAPRIGLPELPAIDVLSGDEEPWINPKTPPVADYIQGRPFIWFDDDLDAADETYLDERQSVGDFLIVHVAASRGLTAAHVKEAADWLAGLAAPAGGES